MLNATHNCSAKDLAVLTQPDNQRSGAFQRTAAAM